MANTKISALTSATTPLAGTEVLPIVQSGATKQLSIANLTAGRAVAALSFESSVSGGAAFGLRVNSTDASTNAVLALRPYAGTSGTISFRKQADDTLLSYIYVTNGATPVLNIFNNQAYGIRLGTNNTDRGGMDVNGNFGLNATPLLNSAGNAFSIGTKALFAGDTSNTSVGSNVYYDSGWKIATTGSIAGGLLQVGNYGRLYFYGTSSGTAGNAATLTQYMFIDGFNGGTTTFGPTSGAAQDMSVNISNTNFYSYLNFQRNGTTFANLLAYYGNGLYYQADAHYFRTSAGTLLATLDNNGNLYGNTSATSMTNGFVYIPGAAGAPSGVPTAVSGHVPMYYDTTNNKFYVYNGAWKGVTLA